jgi:hypothetical protein
MCRHVLVGDRKVGIEAVLGRLVAEVAVVLDGVGRIEQVVDERASTDRCTD